MLTRLVVVDAYSAHGVCDLKMPLLKHYLILYQGASIVCYCATGPCILPLRISEKVKKYEVCSMLLFYNKKKIIVAKVSALIAILLPFRKLVIFKLSRKI